MFRNVINLFWGIFVYMGAWVHGLNFRDTLVSHFFCFLLSTHLASDVLTFRPSDLPFPPLRWLLLTSIVRTLNILRSGGIVVSINWYL
ncbi:hypothetical protein F5Y06DRAFT_26666 [Hypoxylon sp. FL0890]|nr:hypothetical protein F5Y06DRAFT_26666 [Hypoxylon sp. FL0890]